MALILTGTEKPIAEAEKLFVSHNSISVSLKIVFLVLLTLIKTFIKYADLKSANNDKSPSTDIEQVTLKEKSFIFNTKKRVIALRISCNLL